MDKELRKVAKAAEAQGFTWRTTKNGHVEFFLDGKRVTTFSGTPSDGRSWKNAMSYMRKAGFIWPR